MIYAITTWPLFEYRSGSFTNQETSTVVTCCFSKAGIAFENHFETHTIL